MPLDAEAIARTLDSVAARLIVRGWLSANNIVFADRAGEVDQDPHRFFFGKLRRNENCSVALLVGQRQQRLRCCGRVVHRDVRMQRQGICPVQRGQRFGVPALSPGHVVAGCIRANGGDLRGGESRA